MLYQLQGKKEDYNEALKVFRVKKNNSVTNFHNSNILVWKDIFSQKPFLRIYESIKNYNMLNYHLANTLYNCYKLPKGKDANFDII